MIHILRIMLLYYLENYLNLSLLSGLYPFSAPALGLTGKKINLNTADKTSSTVGSVLSCLSLVLSDSLIACKQEKHNLRSYRIKSSAYSPSHWLHLSLLSRLSSSCSFSLTLHIICISSFTLVALPPLSPW
jgi:hypothetical protein